ncbi:hypothetical protein F5Y19DRAFT_484116 [Xylariaceae sp. FL1651]|nr:hypothetical protein F5Y19DRAFT_484116 [Xylariaceae sp. FL1651]
MDGEQPASAANASLEDAPQPQTACLVCRSRKVRCDRQVPSCRNCGRLGVQCPGYRPGAETATRDEILKSAECVFRDAGIQKRRIGACDECRLSKGRCTKTRPSCRRCVEKGLSCVYRTKHRSVASSATPEETVGELVSEDEYSHFNTGGYRLYSDILPEDPALRSRLINAYFDRIHLLGCLSFIHKPSFMYSFDHGSVVRDYGEPLLYIICALGARCVFEPSRCSGRTPGDAWADRARKDVLAEVHVPTIQHIMTMLLLCEHGFRTDRYALVFTLTGCIFRAIRLLSLDVDAVVESLQTSASLLGRQIKDRIVWAAYVVDSIVASGVDQNSMWRSDVPCVPLPWTRYEFLSRTPSPRRYLGSIMHAESLSIVRHFDLPSLVIVLAKARNDILRLIRTAPEPETEIWNYESKFMLLIKKLDVFYQNIPAAYRLTDLNIYVLKDQNLLGAAFQLHFIYHSAVFDLLKISLAGFNFPLACAFRSASPDFRSQCQERCRFHANEVSDLIRQGFEQDSSSANRGYVAFDNPFCGAIAFESAKIQIIYTATAQNDPRSVEVTRRNLRVNFRLFEFLQACKDGQNRFIRALLPLCVTFGLSDFAEEWLGTQSPPNLPAAEVTGSAELHHLSKAAPFRLAQSEIEAQRSSASPRTAPSSSMEGSEQDEARLDRKGPPIVPVHPTTHTHEPQQMAQTPMHPQRTRLEHIDMRNYLFASNPSSGQPTTEEYIRTADEMSSFLILQNSEPLQMPSYQQWPWMYEQNANQFDPT